MAEAGKEIEFKLGVADPEALQRVALAAECLGAQVGTPVRQVNHFFDTAEGALRRSDRTLRLREEAGRFQLTVKGAREAGTDARLHARAEEEIVIDAADAERVLAGEAAPLEFFGRSTPLVAALRAELGGRRLVYSGSFTNERTRVGPLALASAVLELDRTELPGGRVDCEVELELPAGLEDRGRLLLEELLAAAETVGVPVAGKAERFFEALRAEGL